MCIGVARAAAFYQRPQFPEDPHQVRKLKIRIQAARIWQDPENSLAKQHGLAADGRSGLVEGLPICTDPEHRHHLRPEATDLSLEPRSPGPQFVLLQLCCASGRAGDQIRDAQAVFQ